MKIVFFGTPDFAIPTLQMLIDGHHDVVAVVTQPDKPVGRSGKVVFSPVKQLAVSHNIPVLQYDKIRLQGVNDLVNLKADLFVTAAYGQILSKEILEASVYGVYNVHGSLLPKYRGAAPIQWSVINGDKVTGITILKSDVGMDDGDIILTKEVNIGEDETAGELFDRLAILGAECMSEAISRLENGTITFTPQNHEIATKCKMLKKEMNKVDFNLPCNLVKSFILGFNPWPVAEINLKEGRFKVYKAQVVSNEQMQKLELTKDYKVGEVVVSSNKLGLIIKCGEGFVEITEIQAENGKVMSAKSLLNGKQILVGQIANE